MSIFREQPIDGIKGKYSHKRVLSVYLVVLFSVLVIIQFIWGIQNVSDTILGAILGGAITLAVGSVIGNVRYNYNNQRPIVNNRKEGWIEED